MLNVLKMALLLKRESILMFVLVFLVFSCKEKGISKSNTLDAISDKMNQQEKSWNNGDLNGFMKPYWKSDSLSFIGKSGITKGWDKTLSNYKRAYKNKNEMGKLSFTNKSVEFIDKQTIFVIGNWDLSRIDSLGNLSGYYSLVWKQKNGEWVIITDHSS